MKDSVLLNPAKTEVRCYHCGQHCDESFFVDEKVFCCYGCKTVYEILSENDLCEYYQWEQQPGIKLKNETETYAYLDEASVRKKLISYDSNDYSRIRFYVPAIHCSSCIWLLEHLERLHKGILKSEVDFPKKSVCIDFKPADVELSTIASLLAKLGYAPQITLADEKPRHRQFPATIIKMALAGFCFGNVMLFSFPEYLGLDAQDRGLTQLFSYLNIALSIPVLIYSASDYFLSASKSFQQRQINIDVPIAIGLLALFIRSLFDILTGSGPGYLDSFNGLVFFLLIGRWFQAKTYESLAFDRDFKSYFPLAVSKFVDNEWKSVLIHALSKGDQIRIRNMEIVPADSILLEEYAYFDYSFVTGEAKPVKLMKGESVYAGGKLIGKPVTLLVEKNTDQSQLTSLWNHQAFRKEKESHYQTIIDRVARKFTWSVMGIALVTGVYWYFANPAEMWLVVTAVLIVACPCALALAAPFTYGSMLRVFGRNNLYLKNADVIERMASVNAVVFDKTGTVTTGKDPSISYKGNLTDEEKAWVKILASASTHPLSCLIAKSIHAKKDVVLNNFKEFPGKGVEGIVGGQKIRIGSPAFTGSAIHKSENGSLVSITINGEARAHFVIATSIRSNFRNMLNRLGKKCVALLSGDNEADRVHMTALFQPSVQLMFNQSPLDKLEFIQALQKKGNQVLMVGDGLNDSGALQQSDVGIAISDDLGVFTPACDGILQGDKINQLDKFITLAKTSTVILKVGFTISLLYNAIALSFAVTGNLTPLIAAILMPVSSVSVVSFSSFAVNLMASKKLRLANLDRIK